MNAAGREARSEEEIRNRTCQLVPTLVTRKVSFPRRCRANATPSLIRPRALNGTNRAEEEGFERAASVIRAWAESSAFFCFSFCLC